MENNYLKANNLMNEKKWSQAAHYFCKTIEEQCSVEAYKGLARCLRFEGEYDKALRALTKGTNKFPNSAALYSEKYYLLSIQNKWEDAKLIAEKLIELEPATGDHYFKLGRSYNFLKKTSAASSFFKITLEKKINVQIDDVILLIQKKIKSNKTIESRYMYYGGKNNLGAIEHKEVTKHNPKAYFTKILTSKGEKEKILYSTISREYPQLQDITPKLIDITNINNICFITMENIEGNRPQKKHLKKIVESVSNNIASIRYNHSIFNFVSWPNHTPALKKKRSQSVLHFFSRIHEEAINKRLFFLISKRLDSSKYSLETVFLLKKLEYIIMNFKLYTKLNVKKSYAFLHGDFGPHNIIIESGSNRPYVIDWNSYTVGPSWFDLANLFVKLKLSFEEIQKEFLDSKETDKNYYNINQIFFVYALIVIWFQSLSRKKFDKIFGRDLAPAMEYLEKLTLQELSEKEKKVFLRQKKVWRYRMFIEKIRRYIKIQFN